MGDAREIERLLLALKRGDESALDPLYEAVYEPLRQLAHARRLQWRGDYTLNTTALVHEAYLKLVGGRATAWQDRAHFFAAASRAMRHILVNYAARRRAAKRGGDLERVALDEQQPLADDATAEELLALDEALGRLQALSKRQTRVFECRFFSGLQVDETAEALGISPATVKRDWRLARAWLHRALQAELPG